MSTSDSTWLDDAEVPSTTLVGNAEKRYVRRLERIIRRARLNLYYPDPKKLRSHIHAMHPDVHRGLYDGIEIHLDSGLPTYKEWTRVQTDVSVAEEQLRKLGSRKQLQRRVDDRDSAINRKQLNKFDYYSDLEQTTLAPLGDMNVALRRRDPATNTAHFNVVLDKLDASGLFVRFSINLAQQAPIWGDPAVQLDEKETAEHTDAFKSLIYKFTSLDSEFTYAKLAGLGGLEVEGIAKGTVGPFYFAPEQTDSDALARILSEGGDDAVIAMFSLDRVDHDIAKDRDNDPLESPLADRLDDQTRTIYQKARQTYDYRVFRDRKFVAPRNLLPRIRNFCTDRGTKNIVYRL